MYYLNTNRNKQYCDSFMSTQFTILYFVNVLIPVSYYLAQSHTCFNANPLSVFILFVLYFFTDDDCKDTELHPGTCLKYQQAGNCEK